jgi:hypothetical protein
MATNPSFIATPVVASVSVATANTAIDGSGTITTLVTGAATGTRVLEINAQCAATSAAALVNVFVSVDSGTTWRLFDQISITAATVSTTVKANRNSATYANLVLKDATQRLGVTTTISQATNVIALGGDL